MISEERINAQNEINARANEVEGHLLRIFSDWQGIKARKVSGWGGFVKKLENQLNQYESDHGYNQQQNGDGCGDWWLTCSASYTSIIATLRNRKTAQKIEIYLARFNESDGVITQIYDCIQRRTDYTLEGVQDCIRQARALEEQAQQLRSTVRDFSIR